MSNERCSFCSAKRRNVQARNFADRGGRERSQQNAIFAVRFEGGARGLVHDDWVIGGVPLRQVGRELIQSSPDRPGCFATEGLVIPHERNLKHHQMCSWIDWLALREKISRFVYLASAVSRI